MGTPSKFLPVKVLKCDSPQDCHGLHYNRCETSEDQDREAVRVQRMFVGVSSETASTCNSLQSKASKSNFVSKAKAPPLPSTNSAPGSVKSVDTSSKRSAGECQLHLSYATLSHFPHGWYCLMIELCSQVAKKQSRRRRPRKWQPRGQRAKRICSSKS